MREQMQKTQRVQHGSISVLVVLMCLSMLVLGSSAQAEEIGTVTPIRCSSLDMMLRFDPNMVLIDVRKSKELTGPLGNISKACNIPLKQILSDKAVLPADKSLVFICRTGPRSCKAAEHAAKQGRTAYWVQGGMTAWKNEKIITNKQQAKPKPVPKAPLMRKEDKEETPVHILDQDMGC